MKKKYFIKKNHDFQEIINLKNSFANKTFIIYKRKNSLDYCRFGLSVGKKVGNAVMRNKIKRQLRHILRNIDFSCKNTHDIIIITKKNIIEKEFSIIERDLNHALKHFKNLKM